MKKYFSKIFYLFVGLLFSLGAFASPTPPQPATPIPPPSLPINEGLIGLLFFAIILAFYKYKKSFKFS